MKILVQGQPPKPKVFLGTCRICESQLEAMADEVRPVNAESVGDRGTSIGPCPVCKEPRVVFYPK